MGRSRTEGNLFEDAFSEVLVREKIGPFCVGMVMVSPSYVDFDSMLWENLGESYRPVTFALKMSLRERWKQDLMAAYILRSVSPDAVSYLLTADRRKAEKVSADLSMEESPALNGVISVMSHDFDQLISNLKGREYVGPDVANSPIFGGTPLSRNAGKLTDTNRSESSVEYDGIPHCLCGCGRTNDEKARFRLGHDAQIKNVLRRISMGNATGVEIPGVLVKAARIYPDQCEIAGYDAATILEMACGRPSP